MPLGGLRPVLLVGTGGRVGAGGAANKVGAQAYGLWLDQVFGFVFFGFGSFCIPGATKSKAFCYCAKGVDFSTNCPKGSVLSNMQADWGLLEDDFREGLVSFSVRGRGGGILCLRFSLKCWQDRLILVWGFPRNRIRSGFVSLDMSLQGRSAGRVLSLGTSQPRLAYAHGLQEDYEGRDCVKQMICARRTGEGPRQNV